MCYNRLAGVQRQRVLLLNPLPARCGGGEGKLLHPAAVCEFSLDKRNRRRYYVSVSQQNIGYETRKRRNSMGAWFFVVFMIAHKCIIAHVLSVVK